MRCFYPLLFLLFCTGMYAQYSVAFTYDTAGNQVKRELICVSCRTSSDNSNDDLISDYSTDLTKSEEYADIMYYPNPVLEELYIKWNNDSFQVSEINVFSNSGQLVSNYNNLSSVDNTKIPFQNLSEGIYNVVLSYNNGDQKNLKVIKK